ncbi:hypothetical protein [Pontibacter cellulosilyticus]|uniref:Uncharacterized protein n=1 Tax=Pontibacter cellulosilyticus TaxID=1720253 RepID=A0A923N5A7_9BACT|nr:hypothetical protein [Pontibacter cellulosilyticus]MBC5992007.1 hypothetical protein [Pontibacter cellulosilyticus]
MMQEKINNLSSHGSTVLAVVPEEAVAAPASAATSAIQEHNSVNESKRLLFKGDTISIAASSPIHQN